MLLVSGHSWGTPQECLDQSLQKLSRWPSVYALFQVPWFLEDELGFIKINPNNDLISQLKTEDQKLVTEWLLDFCNFESGYQFRPLKQQLLEELLIWHQKPSVQPKLYWLTVLWVQNQFSNTTQLQETLLEVLMDFLRTHTAELNQDVFNQIVNRQFNGFTKNILNHGFSVNSQNQLQIPNWTTPSEMIFSLFHELTHVQKSRTTLHQHWQDLKDQKEELFLELAVFEEAKAQFWTNEFKKAWKLKFSQYSIGVANKSALDFIDHLLRALSDREFQQNGPVRQFIQKWQVWTFEKKKDFSESVFNLRDGLYFTKDQNPDSYD